LQAVFKNKRLAMMANFANFCKKDGNKQATNQRFLKNFKKAILSQKFKL